MKNLIGVAMLALMTTFSAQAQGPYQEGQHYFAIDQAANASPTGKVEVAEIFSYLCTHCNTFDPYVEHWRTELPEFAEFKRIPVVFGRRQWELYAKGYVAAELMGIADESHAALMEYTWKQQKLFRSMDDVANFYSQFGVERNTFLATSQSFAVDAAMRKGQKATQDYGVRGTPSMVVNGKYRITNNAAVPDYETMLAVASYLVELEKPVAVEPVSGPAEASSDNTDKTADS